MENTLSDKFDFFNKNNIRKLLYIVIALTAFFSGFYVYHFTSRKYIATTIFIENEECRKIDGKLRIREMTSNGEIISLVCFTSSYMQSSYDPSKVLWEKNIQ